MNTTAIILAGGKSSRMGENKALLKVEGKMVIERMAHELSQITDQLLLVTNTFEEYQFLQLPMVEDKYKGKGPLAGIHAGLEASITEHNLIVACDMPFASSDLGAYLLSGLKDYQAVIPKLDGRLHPLFGAYRKDILSVVTPLIENNQLRIQGLLDHVHLKVVTEKELQSDWVSERAVFNMNNRDDYEQALRMVRDSK